MREPTVLVLALDGLEEQVIRALLVSCTTIVIAVHLHILVSPSLGILYQN